jgi:lysophospholipase L1-like esterase
MISRPDASVGAHCRCVLLVAALAVLVRIGASSALSADADPATEHWIGTWATAPQPAIPSRVQTFRNQTVRLIVHISAGGKRVRIKISNTYGEQPLLIGAAHLARRAHGADIDAPSDRKLTFDRKGSTKVAAGAMAVSDPVDLQVPALSDLAISLFFPEAAAATSHTLAMQTNYVSAENGDSTAAVIFPVNKTIGSWPFLTGVDVTASPGGAAIVAFGSSTTDGDGSTEDSNHRWPDVLAERLQKEANGKAELGVLNEGIIGNRLLNDVHSPRQRGGPFEETLRRYGNGLGDAGVARFERDVLDQAGVKFVVLVLGINDILFPGAFIPASESVSAEQVIAGNRQLIERAHKQGIRVIETTIPPFEDATFQQPVIKFSTPEKEAVRQQVNAWIRGSREFEGMIDFDEVLRDPSHPARLLPKYDAGDHLHANDAGYIASGNAVSPALFRALEKSEGEKRGNP